MTHFYTYESHAIACVTVSGIVRLLTLRCVRCRKNRFVCAVKSRNTQSENTCIPNCMGVHICWNSQLGTLRYIVVRPIRKVAESENWRRHVCPSVRTEDLGSRWTDFCEISYLSMFRKSVEKLQVSLKSDKNGGYFT